MPIYKCDCCGELVRVEDDHDCPRRCKNDDPVRCKERTIPGEDYCELHHHGEQHYAISARIE